MHDSSSVAHQLEKFESATRVRISTWFKSPSLRASLHTLNQALRFRHAFEKMNQQVTPSVETSWRVAMEQALTLKQCLGKLGTEPMETPPNEEWSRIMNQRDAARELFISHVDQLDLDSIRNAMRDLEEAMNNFSPISTHNKVNEVGDVKKVAIGSKLEELEACFAQLLTSPDFEQEKWESSFRTLVLELIELCKLSVNSASSPSPIDKFREIAAFKTELDVSFERELMGRRKRAETIQAKVLVLRDTRKSVRKSCLELEYKVEDEIDANRRENLQEQLKSLRSRIAEIEALKNKLDGEMCDLCVVDGATWAERYSNEEGGMNEEPVCVFPELFHSVKWAFQGLDVVKTMSNAKAFISKSNLLAPYDSASCFEVPGELSFAPRSERVSVVKVKGTTRHIVLKFVPPNEDITRLRRALLLSRKVVHPCILACEGVVENDRGRLELVFPYMPGGDLEFWLRLHPRPVNRVFDMGTQVLGGLVALHQARIVHRDIKPGNIVMSSIEDDAVPKLTDFEFSKEIYSGFVTHRTTTLVGTTLEFRAPEVETQDMFKFSREEVELQDVFSFGKTMEYALENTPNKVTDTHDVKWTLLDRMTSRVVNDRPTAVEALSVYKLRTCMLCLEEKEFGPELLVCPSGQHYVCTESGCFARLVQNDPAHPRCCGTCEPFTDAQLMMFAEQVFQARLELEVSKLQVEMEKVVEERVKQGIVELSCREIENLLTSTCPHCRRAFHDFDGCCAVTCQSDEGMNIGCGGHFCAHCFTPFQNSALTHQHVRQCRWNPVPGDLYRNASYERQQAERKRQQVNEYLAGLPVDIRDKIRERSALVREWVG